MTAFSLHEFARQWDVPVEQARDLIDGVDGFAAKGLIRKIGTDAYAIDLMQRALPELYQDILIMGGKARRKKKLSKT